MALPILGKYIVLPLLLLFIYVTYGFRIRDVGHTGSVEQHNACILDDTKCNSIDTAINQVTLASLKKKNRHDTGEIDGIGRIKFNNDGAIRKFNVDTKDIKREYVKELKNYRYKNVKLKVNVNKGNNIDDKDKNISDNDDDDSDEDVVIEDDEEFDGMIDDDDNDDENLDKSNSEDNDDFDDDVNVDDDNESSEVEDTEDLLEKVDGSIEQDSKWNVQSVSKKKIKGDWNNDKQVDDNDDSKVNVKGIIKRNDVKKISSRNIEYDGYMKNNRIQVENFSSDVEKKDKSDKNLEIKVTSDKNIVTLRKLERVRLADKDKVKSIEVANVKGIEDESHKIERNEKITNNIDNVPLNNNQLNLLIDDDNVNDNKPVMDEKKLKNKTEIANNDTKEIIVKSVKKIATNNTNEKYVDVNNKMGNKSKIKLNSKIKDSDTNKDSMKIKKKLITSKKHSDTSISLSKLNDDILRLPNFVPNFTSVENPICQQHGKIFLRQLRGYKLWALQMLDSSAKIPSGLLRGNVNQLGDYDQCLGISARVKVDDKTVKVQGKYCLANIDIFALIPDMKVPVNLIQSRSFLRGTMHDTGHFVPKFTTINWALCLPSVCSSTDAQIAISNALSYYNMTSGLKLIVDVDEDMCYVRERGENYSKETIGVLYFYAMILCLVFVATLRDFFIVTEEKANYSERIIMSFSLRRTIKILVKPGEIGTGDINCIHGIRSLATIALYIGHKMIPIAGLPYSNRIILTEISNNPMSSLLRVSIVYTDSFLILSGVLSAFHMSKESGSRGEIRWFCRIVARFIRLTPALLVIIFWYAYVMEHIGSGPQWNIIKENSDLCKKNSWTNLLYIQNFFPFEEMCATHTHQLALDMQLSLLAPILVFFLQIKPIIGILLIFFLLQVSATLRYFSTINNYLSVVIFHGMTVKHLYKTANLTYAVSIHRITPYLFGIGLGVIMHYTGKNVKIYRIFVIFGWIFAFLLGTWSIFSPWSMSKRDYTYDTENIAYYTVIGPITWALSLCWIIFACFTDHAGIINRFLSNYWLIVFSRISYSVYLTQFAVFFYNMATTRYSSEFQIHRAIDFYEILMIIIVSTILTLFFDIPMQEVKSVLMESTDINVIKINNSKIKFNDNNKKCKIPINNNENNNDDHDYNCIDITQNINDKSSIVSNYYDDKSDNQPWKCTRDENNDRERKRSKSVQRNYNNDVDVKLNRELTANRYHDDIYRGRRSLSRTKEINYNQLNYREDFRDSKRDDINEIRRERLRKLSRKTPIRLISSGSDDELLQRRENSPRRQIERPRVSDEEDWEHELRIRRRRFIERMAADVHENKLKNNDSQDIITRRSSAEGKIALLTGANTECRGIDAWTVSRGGPHISIISGSSQDISDNDDDSCFTGNNEQSEEERKIPTSLDYTEEDDEYDIELSNVSNNRTKMMDVRQLSNDDNYIDNIGNLSTNDINLMASGKLFKRESIVKSQASEEDPEYLLPERPKLVEQEQEHPFKKAWQMQKSRSEEDGPSAFTYRDVKVQQIESNQIDKNSSSSVIIRTTPQTFQLVVEDVDLNSKPLQNDENIDIRSNNDEEQSLHYSDDNKSTEFLPDDAESCNINWTNEDEEFN